jgi:Tfp pilus assembly major pilin PilA
VLVSRAARSGFSIVETVAILVIIAILLLIAIPQFTRPSLAALAAPDSVVAPRSFGTLAVKVSDSRGTPQQGVAVRFEAEGMGTVSPAEASTDSTGVAHAVWQAAADTGALAVTARAAGRARPALVMRTRVRGPVPATPVSSATRGSQP